MSVDPVSLGITLALTAAQMAAQASRRIDGPRLPELAVSTADYGTPVLNFHGTRLIDACPIIWAEKRKEVIQRRKTKGGKTSNAIYFGTWAILVAGHPSDAVLQILFNKQLVYDATGAGPVTPFAIGYSTVGKSGRPRERTVNLTDHMRIYTGAEDQLPDPRMQATIDAEYGDGSTPAYRGVTIVVFEDVPLEKFGNQVPTCGVLATRAADPAWPYEDFPDQPFRTDGSTAFSISPDGTRLIAGHPEYQIWDLPTRSVIAQGDMGDVSYSPKLGVYNDGSFLAVSGDKESLRKYSADGVFQGNIATFPSSPLRWQDSVCVVQDGDGREYWATIGFSNVAYFYFDGVEHRMVDLTGAAWLVADWFADAHGDIWAVGRAFGTSGITTCHFYRMVNASGRGGPGYFTATGLAPTVASLDLPDIQGLHLHDEDSGLDQFVIFWEGDDAYAIEPDTGTVLASYSNASIDVDDAACAWKNHVPGAPTIWLRQGSDFIELNLSDLTERRRIATGNWSGAGTFNAFVYSSVLNAHLCFSGAPGVFVPTRLTIRYLDRTGSDAVTFASVAAEIAELCDVGAGDVDFAALTQPVRGYSWTQGSGKDVLDPLREIHDVDFRPHDFVLQGLPRGGASGGAIASSDFARIDREDPAFSAPTDGGTDLPRLLRMTFADADADQQVNAALAPRLSGGGGSVRSVAVDMSNLVMTAAEGQQAAERMMRRRVFDAQTIPLALTGQYASIEPGDVRTLMLGAAAVVARLSTASPEGNGSIATEWTRDDPSVHSLSGSAGAAQDGWVTPEMFIPSPTRAVVADVTLATDAHDTAVPFLYYAAGPLANGAWSGAEWQVSDTAMAEDFVGPWASVASGDAMTWGFTTAAIPDALPWLFDRGSAVNVMMGAGATLTSVPEADLLDDGALNLLLVGGEYLQFATATLESDGSYTLTNLLRGCRGTEAAIATHIAGETLVVVDSKLFRREVGAGEIGDTDAYRATSLGGDPVASPSTTIAFTAAAQRPYAPVHGLLTLDTGSGDWSVAATRRTRVGGANVDGGDVPLGEVSEAWAADIMNGATVVRTITGTSLPLVYSSADQTTDWGAPQTSLDVNLYQVSPALSLRGYPLAIAA